MLGQSISAKCIEILGRCGGEQVHQRPFLLSGFLDSIRIQPLYTAFGGQLKEFHGGEKGVGTQQEGLWWLLQLHV